MDLSYKKSTSIESDYSHNGRNNSICNNSIIVKSDLNIYYNKITKHFFAFFNSNVVYFQPNVITTFEAMISSNK